MLKKVCLYLIFAITGIIAGVNEKAVFYMDMIPTTVEVESTYVDTLLNQNFEVAVWVDSVVDLKSFSVRLKVVSDKYTYFDCSEDGHGRKNILDGGMFFNDDQGDKIELVGSLQDSASSLTSGLLGFFTFTSKLTWGESVAIEFFDASLVALNTDEDVFTSPLPSLHAGTYSIKPLPQCTITVIQTPNGTITPAGPVFVTQGQNSPEFVITPNQSYQIADVLVDAVSAGIISSYTFQNVTENHTITASFDLVTAVVPGNSINSCVRRFFARSNMSLRGSQVHFFFTGNKACNGTISIYDLFGKKINEIVFALHEIINGNNPSLIAQWDLKDKTGGMVAGGTYLAVLQPEYNSQKSERYLTKIKIK